MINLNKVNCINIIFEAKEILLTQVASLHQVSYDDYTKKLPVLSDSSIGEHNRHIIELFQQLTLGFEQGVVNYDKRIRNTKIQENPDYAIECIAVIISKLDRPNKNLQLETVYNDSSTIIETNYFRELIFNVEHCIHHQAIMKIGLRELGIDIKIENLGVAKSTVLYKQSCAQ